jgi:hypothetical protein
MTGYQILWNSSIVVTVLSCLVMVFSALFRKDKLVLASAALVLSNANSPPVNAITANMGLELGASWFFIGLVGLVLILCYRLDVGRILFAFPNLTGGVLAFLAFCYFSLVSPIVAYDRVAAVRRSFSFLLIFIVGWRIFGLVFRQRPELTRSRLYSILYAVGTWGIVQQVATLLLMGPKALHREIGGVASQITIAGRVVSRLQAPGLLNATGLAMGAAGSIFLVVHWLKVFSGIRRVLLMGLLPLPVLVLCWAAGRTAMFAFWATSVVLSFMEFRAARSKARPVLILLLIGLLPVLLWSFVVPLWMRGGVVQSVSDIFVQARLDSAIRSLRFLKSYLILGAGSGALDYAVEDQILGGVQVESFFFQVLIEFGLIGGLLYVLAWLSLTFAILRTDFYYLRQGCPAAWLPSSSIIFVWATSPASYGFGLFNGSLALSLAIGAAAMIDWASAKRALVKGVHYVDLPQRGGNLQRV